MTALNLPDAFPLRWPDGWERTKRRKKSRYQVTPSKARKDLRESVRLLGGVYPIISTNMPLRADGQPMVRFNPDDPGVAVYWVRNGKQEVMACDRWKEAWENMRAVYLAIEGLRAMERAGATQIMERAFTAFQLPAPASTWREVLGVERSLTPSADYLRRLFREQAVIHHPDNGGSEEEFKRVQKAFQEAMDEVSN